MKEALDNGPRIGDNPGVKTIEFIPFVAIWEFVAGASLSVRTTAPSIAFTAPAAFARRVGHENLSA